MFDARFWVGKVYRIWTPKGGPPQYDAQSLAPLQYLLYTWSCCAAGIVASGQIDCSDDIFCSKEWQEVYEPRSRETCQVHLQLHWPRLKLSANCMHLTGSARSCQNSSRQPPTRHLSIEIVRLVDQSRCRCPLNQMSDH